METSAPDIGAIRNSLTQVKDTPGAKTFRWLNYFGLTLLCFVTLYPFVNLIAQAFSSDAAIRTGQVQLWPVGFNLTTFQGVLTHGLFWRNYANTLLYTIIHVTVAMFLTTTFAYVISRTQLKGRNAFIGLAVFTMFFGGGMVPSFVVIGFWYGLRDTIWAVTIPGALSVFNLLVMKSFFENFPKELEEAAAIDGLTQYSVFTRIVLPLSKAVLATMTLFYSVAMWNAWFGSMMFLRDRNMMPVMMYLRNLIAGALAPTEVGDLQDQAQIGANIQAVTMLLTVLPIICAYPFVQKYFVSGVMLGSVKG
ncbi:MAG: carbohydrate ABC transporter permease [Promicromonosporaceae bacterium]|nr:carbohydrate ABC transporter permease [Promicromonosporaceae bacterium]